MNDNRDAIDFANEPIGKLFRKMFLPTLVSMVSMVVLNITDGAFVGHGVGSDALAAVNIVAPLFLIVSGLGLMLGIGSSVVASVHLSKGNVKAASINLTQGLVFGALLGLVLGVLVYIYQEELCVLFGCSESLIPLACSYMKWIAMLTPFNMIGMIGMFTVRLDGSPRFAMAINCSMAILNIVLDYILIYHTNLGLEGAAIATSVSFTLGNIPLLWYLLYKVQSVYLYKIKVSSTSLRLSLRNIIYQMRIGVSALMGEIAVAVVIIAGNYVFMRYLGEDGVAAYSVGCYCLPIVFMMGNAIVQSVQPILSFAYGVGDEQRIYKARQIAVKTALVSGVLGMAIMWIGAGVISNTFLDSGCRAYDLCCQGLPYFSPAFLVVAINIVMIGFFQSIEATRDANVFTALRGFILSIPCFVLMPELLGVPGLWLALPVAEAVTLILMAVKMRLVK